MVPSAKPKGWPIHAVSKTHSPNPVLPVGTGPGFRFAGCFYATVAQLAERLPCKQQAAGPTPARGTTTPGPAPATAWRIGSCPARSLRVERRDSLLTRH